MADRDCGEIADLRVNMLLVPYKMMLREKFELNCDFCGF